MWDNKQAGITWDRHPACLSLFLGLCTCLWSLPTSAQDILITKTQNSDQLAKRRGTIVDWRGSTVTIDSGGREKKVDALTIVDVQTDWPPGFQQGQQLLDERKFDEAFQMFEMARQKEQRIWVQHEILAGMIQCLRGTENNSKAIRLFAEIVAADPETRFYFLIPLEWTAARGGKPADDDTARWMNSDNSTLKLIGSSWRMSGASRSAAIESLKALAQDTDPRVAHLANAQLWKANALTAGESEISRWQRQIDLMPNALRAGPWFVLAEAQSRNNLFDDAAINFMRIPILYPANRALVAPALYQAGKVLQNAQRKAEATNVWSELVRDYPKSYWAGQTAGKLDE